MRRGSDESTLSFAITNQHGDVENFGYFEYKYSTDAQFLCARSLGFHLNTWSFPQGPVVTLTYAQLEDQETLPPDELPGYTWELTKVANNMGREIDLDYGITGGILMGFNDGHGRSVTASAGDMPGTTDTLGHLTGFAYLPLLATTPTQRPVPYHLLGTITTPDQPTLPHTEYDYDSEGRIEQVKNAEVLQKFDRLPYQFFLADGTRGARQDPLGGLYSVVYDTYGHPSRYIDELGRETDALIDSRERPMQYLFPENDCELYAYDDHNNVTSLTKEDKVSGCNAAAIGNHRLLTRATWDQTWNKITALNTPLGNITNFTYYASGNGKSLLATATRPAVYFDATHTAVSPVYSFAYDAMGRVTSSVVPFTPSQSITTSLAYDPTTENLLTSTLDAGASPHINAVTSYGYDAFGNVTSTVDPRGNTTEDVFDGERRKTESHHHDGSITAALNQASRTTYDALGRDIKDESGLTFSGASVLSWQTDKTTTYTPTSKAASVTDADLAVTLTSYDGLDRTDTITDPVGREDHFAYDAAGNTLTEFRAWQSSLQQAYATYTYGAENEKLSVADANTNITTYGYDGFNRLLTTTYPDSTIAHPDVETLVYDKDSNITSRTTRAGQALTYAFDALDRMLTKVMPAVSGVNPQVTTTWAYYLNGSVNALTDTNANSLTYGYDSAARATSVSTAIPGLTGYLVTGYQLDPIGNRTQLTWPDGYFVTYAYDSLDRMLTAKESGAATIATYTYDTLSRRLNLAYPHASAAYTYSPAGDLKTLTNTIAGTGTVPNYTLGYSPAHQLNGEASSQTSYNFQPAANATDSYGSPNSLNQYKTINDAPANGHDCQGNAQQYSYDCDGNLTGDGIWAYGYDPENRLITASKTSGGTVTATYSYDPNGRRTAKSGAGVITAFYLDDSQDEIAEYNSAGTPTWRYIPSNAINEPIAAVAVSTGARRFYQRDHHGSVVAAVNNAGTQIEGPYTYDPYGNGAPTTGSAFKYVGMRLDPETGLYYDRARYYWPGGGRFLQTDPVGYGAGLNLYTYATNDPSDKLDPSGRQVTADPMGGLWLQGIDLKHKGWTDEQIRNYQNRQIAQDEIIWTKLGTEQAEVVALTVAPELGMAGVEAFTARFELSAAFRIAALGGRNGGELASAAAKTTAQLEKTISTLSKNIAEHEGYIADPTTKVADWASRSAEYQKGLIIHWKKEIQAFKEQMDITNDVLHLKEIQEACRLAGVCGKVFRIR